MLEKYLRVYVVCLEEDFMDGFDPSLFDLIVFDEFRGQKKITWMNSFVQGGTVPVRIKGSRGVKITDRDNLPVLVLSNYSIAECYHKADSIAVSTIKSRFEECQIIEDGYRSKLSTMTLFQQLQMTKSPVMIGLKYLMKTLNINKTNTLL